jgi:hypothetical protein
MHDVCTVDVVWASPQKKRKILDVQKKGVGQLCYALIQQSFSSVQNRVTNARIYQSIICIRFNFVPGSRANT